MDKLFLDSLKNSTPILQDFKGYLDADDEIKPIAEEIRKYSNYLNDLEIGRIKFLYSSKPKKNGEMYDIFNLFMRNEIDKTIDDSYDFVLTIYHEVWKQLDPERKVIALDKALCGIDYGTIENPKMKKKSPDVFEYKTNMNHYGAQNVMNTSEAISLACERIIEQKKEEKKAKAEAKKNKNQGQPVLA